MGQVSKVCGEGQGRGCLRSTSQKGAPGTPSKRTMSVFGRSLPEKGRPILYVGDWKVLEILLIHVGFALVILKPCFCLIQVISLSLISGAGGRSWEKPVRKQYILLNYIHSFFFLMVFRLTVPPSFPLIVFFSGLEDFSSVNSCFSLNLCKAYYTNAVQGPAAGISPRAYYRPPASPHKASTCI